MSPDAWSKILHIYGPSAVLVFLLVVVKIIRNQWCKADEKNDGRAQTLCQVLFGLTVVFIFGVAISVIYAWWVTNILQPPTIKGRVEMMPATETFRNPSADLYLHKRDESGGYATYDLLLINRDNEPWTDGTRFSFIVQTPAPGSNDEALFQYDLPIKSDFPETGIILRRQDSEFLLYHNDTVSKIKGTEIPRSSSATPTPTPTPTHTGWSLVPTAYAQAAPAKFKPEVYRPGLESPDLVVRRKTREALSQETDALPWINEILSDPKESYRMQLGVLVALNLMQTVPLDALSSAAIATIQNNLNVDDEALRHEAQTFADKKGLVPVTVYEDANYSGIAEFYGPGTFVNNKHGLGKLPNDSASSVKVKEGYVVTLCDSEGNGNGGGVCEVKGPGKYNLERVADKVSFIKVSVQMKKGKG